MQNDLADNNQRAGQEAYEKKPRELIVQIIEKEVLFDGEVCQMLNFRDISNSFHYEQIMIHLKLEKQIQ